VRGVSELLLLMSVMSCGFSVSAQMSQGNSLVTVGVYNDSDASDRALVEAEDICKRIFREAGVGVEWVNVRHSGKSTPAGTQAPDTTLTLRIVLRPLTLTDTTFGVAFLAEDGSGRYADVFYGPVRKLSGAGGVSQSTLLAHVMAHEIGHLLLGSNAHVHLGLMRAHWDSDDLRRAAMGGLLFTSEEAQRMRSRLLVEPGLNLANGSP
jgi:hypothetical protein